MCPTAFGEGYTSWNTRGRRFGDRIRRRSSLPGDETCGARPRKNFLHRIANGRGVRMKSIMGGFMMSLLFLLSGSADALAERINFSFSSLTGTQSPLWVAKEAGFFQKQGLDARLAYIPGGR